MITDPADTARLIFDARCVHNLATYLDPRRAQVAALGRPAVVVKGCDAKAVAGLLREAQLERDDVVLIGVHCGGVVHDPTWPAELTRGDRRSALRRLRRARRRTWSTIWSARSCRSPRR